MHQIKIVNWIQVWALNRQDQITTKMIMPGILQVLVVSPCNNFCVGAMNERLLIWSCSTGKLVASLRRHYQNVSDVKFTGDSSRFISAGVEGLVLLWSLDTVLHTKVSGTVFPDWLIAHHHLLLLFISGMWARLNLVWPFPTCDWSPCDKISDPAVGIFRIIGSNLQNPRSQYRSNVVQHPIQWGKLMSLAPISRDFSLSLSLCQMIYQTFISFQPLRSVVVDHAEESCYVGSHEGKIYRIDLLDPSRSVEQMVDETASRKMFLGHEKAVTCLSVSTGGCHLLSGEQKKNTNSVNDEKFHFQQHFFFAFIKQVRMTVALVCGTWPAANVSVFWLIAGRWRTRFSLPGTNIWRRTSSIRVSSSTRSKRNATTVNCWAPKTNSPPSCWLLVRLWWTTHPAIHPSLCPYWVVKATSSRIKWRKMRWNVWNSSIANCTPLQPTRFSRKMRHRWPWNENNFFFLSFFFLFAFFSQ